MSRYQWELEQRMIGEPFFSKKNRVFKIDLDGYICVAKVYAEEFRLHAEMEYRILSLCLERSVPAPRPIEFKDDSIIMSFVDGENAADAFHSHWDPSSNAEQEWQRVDCDKKERIVLLLDRIAYWLAAFHRAFNWELVRGDSILRNFIVQEEMTYGLDFEEASEKDTLSDLGDTCAYILSTRPKFTAGKFALARAFARSYWHHAGRDRSTELAGAVAASLEHYARFRADKEELCDWANKIRRSWALGLTKGE